MLETRLAETRHGPVGPPPADEAYECCILGAGPAGLAAALELCKNGVRNIIVIDRNAIPGGLSRTETFDGSRFDVGPHRFFTKSQEINALWHETLGTDFRPVKRKTRILFRDAFYQYPLRAGEVLQKLGPIEATCALLSFARARLGPQDGAASFEDWVVQRFGRKLYETFFKTYTEKVWGIPCSRIGAEWAAQRIKGLDLVQTVKKALFDRQASRAKSLVDEFHYPVLGAGQMYEAMCDTLAAYGVSFSFGSRVSRVNWDGERVQSVTVTGPDGEPRRVSARHFFNSIPITQFIKLLTPAPPAPILRAAEALFYREHITVNLLVDGEDLFPDQWIYVHSPDVQTARLANYNNFSPAMAGHKGKTALSVEYFVFQSDDLWRRPDADVSALAVDELARVKLIDAPAVERTWVVRETESYPTYYLGFREPYLAIRGCFEAMENVSPIGRGGMYKYNNQDHAAMTGLFAARNYLRTPESPYDVWEVNVDCEYHESIEEKGRALAGARSR